MPGEPLNVATLNTRGIPLTGSQLATRLAVIGAGFEAGDADVVCCQEVFTYWHLRQLVRRMRSFRQVSYVRRAAGPAGGLVTFSRRPVSGTRFRRFGRPPPTPGVPRLSRFRAGGTGVLVTRLGCPELCVLNTHPIANHDGDWSETNRYYPLHRAQLGVLARVVSEAGPRAVVCGDFNVPRESSLFGGFMAATGLADAFAGTCPPTFRAEYLPAGATTHCIDFILTAGEVTADRAALVFAAKERLGFVSDHIGLRARLAREEDDEADGMPGSRRSAPGPGPGPRPGRAGTVAMGQRDGQDRRNGTSRRFQAAIGVTAGTAEYSRVRTGQGTRHRSGGRDGSHLRWPPDPQGAGAGPVRRSRRGAGQAVAARTAGTISVAQRARATSSGVSWSVLR